MGRDAVIDIQAPAIIRAEEPGTGLSRRSSVWLVAIFNGIVVAALMSLIHLPYAILQPGSITNTLGNGPDGKPLITVQGRTTYPTAGALDFTTVEVLGGPRNPVNVWEWIAGHLDSSSKVVPEDQMFPRGVTSKQVEQESAAEMVGSQQEAIAVALRGLGQVVPEVVSISAVTKGSPASGVLRTGDVLVSVDGKAASGTDTVRAAIRAHKAGERAVFTVRRGGKEQVLPVTTIEAGNLTVVGVILRAAFDFPTKVSIKAVTVKGQVVGGPSAGMMFALAIYDKLTPGALTGGANIAGTGTIDSAGKVGPIGGIRQKLVGAKEGGAAWFLAPAGNCNEVVGHVPEGLKVVKIATFKQALETVEAIAAKRTTSLPSCP